MDDFARGLKQSYFSAECRSVYLLLILINIVLICWTLSLPGGYDGGTIFLFAQVLVNAILIAEVAVRYIGSPDVWFHTKQHTRTHIQLTLPSPQRRDRVFMKRERRERNFE